MTNKKDNWGFSIVEKPELENDQWFPENPTKPLSKWSFIIGLLDELTILIVVVVVIWWLVGQI